MLNTNILTILQTKREAKATKQLPSRRTRSAAKKQTTEEDAATEDNVAADDEE